MFNSILGLYTLNPYLISGVLKKSFVKVLLISFNEASKIELIFESVGVCKRLSQCIVLPLADTPA